jgi:hypothetical protein
MAGCMLDRARADLQKVKCDRARCWSVFPNDRRDRAEGRATRCNDGRDRAEGRPALGTGGCAGAQERATFLPARAFVRRVGRLFSPGEASVPGASRLFLPTAAFARSAGCLLYRWVRPGKTSGGLSYRLAPFRGGSDGISKRFARFVRSPGRFPNTRLHWRARRCRLSDWSLSPSGRLRGLGVHSCTIAFHIVNVRTGRCTKPSVLGTIQLPARPRSPRIHRHRRRECAAFR